MREREAGTRTGKTRALEGEGEGGGGVSEGAGNSRREGGMKVGEGTRPSLSRCSSNKIRAGGAPAVAAALPHLSLLRELDLRCVCVCAWRERKKERKTERDREIDR